jgi:hypothetical protein
MTDLSQPASAAEFERAGVDAATAAALAMQHNIMAGRGGAANERVALQVSTRNQPPPAKPAAPAPSVTPAEATAALEAHTQAQLSAHLEDVFAPPALATDYRFPEGATAPTDEQSASVMALRTALHSEGIPRVVAENIALSAANASVTLANESMQQAQTRIASQKASLVRMWGQEAFEGNLAKVDTFLQGLRSRSPALASFIDSYAHAFSPTDVDLLLQLAQHRVARQVKQP